jgi:hypothetical protein
MIPKDQWERERQIDGTFRILCMRCGRSVSGALAEPVIVRAWVECPECMSAHPDGPWNLSPPQPPKDR